MSLTVNLQKFGQLTAAEFTLGDLTILGGEDNCGMAQALYTVYGFLAFWHEEYRLPVDSLWLRQFAEKHTIEIDLTALAEKRAGIIKDATEKFRRYLPSFLSAEPASLEAAAVDFILPTSGALPAGAINTTLAFSKKCAAKIVAKRPRGAAVLTLQATAPEALPESDNLTPVLSTLISDCLKKALFGGALPEVFISTAGRSGAALFAPELGLRKHPAFAVLGGLPDSCHSLDLLAKLTANYSAPLGMSVDLPQRAGVFAKAKSFLAADFPEVGKQLKAVLGGEFKTSRAGEIVFTSPRQLGVKETLRTCPPRARALFELAFYLRHLAQPGDLLLIEEPENNLSAAGQREMARLLAALLKAGLKVMLTTQSEHLVRELSALVMLGGQDAKGAALAKKFGYRAGECLPAEKVKAYFVQPVSVTPPGKKRAVKLSGLCEAAVSLKSGIAGADFTKAVARLDDLSVKLGELQ